jgi:thiosulfate reductase / polysulfide reductase chain A
MNSQNQGSIEVKRAICGMCHFGCGLRVHVQNNEPLKIEGDPQNPDSKGFICIKGMAGIDFHLHPSRVNYPLKRKGKRGEGQWERISWQQAMDEIGAKLKDVKREFGPEAVAVIAGSPHEPLDWALWRWCNLFGTPNYMSQGRNCGVSEFLMECAVNGYTTSRVPVPGVTKCGIVWGGNQANSNPPPYNTILEAKRQGMKLIVVDPRRSETAAKADLWLQLRPGTDGALALSMLHVIINEGLYDKDFVAKWCLGFEEVKDYVQEYTPQRGEEITWISADKIVEAARLYATNLPAFISYGLAICHLGRAGKSGGQAKAILRAITGNLDIQGGNVLSKPLEKYAWFENLYWDLLLDHPERKRDNVSADVFPITSVRGYRLFREAMKKVYPRGYGSAMYMLVPSPGDIRRAVVEKSPYPIKILFTQGSNPLMVFAQPRKFYEAYMSDQLELHVTMELFMTPTAQLADYVLPATSWLERPHIKTRWGLQDCYTLGEQSVAPLYERRDDYHLWCELGKRVGQEELWPDTLEKMYDRFLEPAGVTYKELMAKEEHWYYSPQKYRRYEQEGFATFSGKVELTPSIFEKLGIDPLPCYEEPPRSPLATPELAKQYPLILISGSRVKPFVHSCFRQIEKLRKVHPDPSLEIHPQTAKELGIIEGDWVYIETPEGRVKQKAKITEGIDPRVVHADGYWWYPERQGNVPQLFDVWESNINTIIPDGPEFCDYAGDNYFRALLCRVYKT